MPTVRVAADHAAPPQQRGPAGAFAASTTGAAFLIAVRRPAALAAVPPRA